MVLIERPPAIILLRVTSIGHIAKVSIRVVVHDCNVVKENSCTSHYIDKRDDGPSRPG